MARFACLCVLIFLSTCAPRNPVGRGLFPMDSLLSAQAAWLSGARASLTKQVLFGTKREEITLTPVDTAAWLKELEAFAVMDAINKPINRDRYVVNDTPDTKSNLLVRAFSIREDLPVRSRDDVPVTFVRLYYHRSPSSIRKIEAAYVEHNGLYKTKRMLSMEFNDLNGTPVMTSYSIVGGQKMFLDDTVQYDIKGKVRLEIK